jgi:hypothetical protein
MGSLAFNIVALEVCRAAQRSARGARDEIARGLHDAPEFCTVNLSIN